VRTRSRRNLAIAASGALAFGVGVSIFKGNGSGVRDAIGNLSAPWLILPFAAGAGAGGGRVGRGALVGALVSLLALGGFYFANSFVLALGAHPWLLDLRLAFGEGYFFRFAALSGPIFGGLGGWWTRSRSRALAVAVAALLVFEPLAWLAYSKIQGLALVYGYAEPVWAVEVLVGIAVCALLARGLRPRRPPAS
jgi:hypothetical protein